MNSPLSQHSVIHLLQQHREVRHPDPLCEGKETRQCVEVDISLYERRISEAYLARNWTSQLQKVWRY
jgi:hypothetical protein